MKTAQLISSDDDAGKIRAEGAMLSTLSVLQTDMPFTGKNIYDLLVVT